MKSKNLVLVGQPNSGKSTIFNVVSDIKSLTSNFAGTTDKIESSDINIYGETYSILDMPGAYSLNPGNSSERLVYDFLLNTDVDLIINVVDASLLTRSLELTVELAELGIPMVIALNMLDEAENMGINIDPKKLEEELGIPVVPTIAVYGKGIKELTEKCSETLNKQTTAKKLQFTKHISEAVDTLSKEINDELPTKNGNPDFFAIKLIENPDIFPDNYKDKFKEIRNKIAAELYEEHQMDGFETIAYERHHQAMKISEEITSYRQSRKRPIKEQFDDYLLHPIWGHVFLAVFFFLYFLTIFLVGSNVSDLIAPPIDYLATLYEPLKETQPFLWSSIHGAYLGFSGVFGLILPYFLPLVLLTSLFEETGYMSRIAFMVDGVMHKLGLHGKSVVPFILGFGCSVPALYATRMIENKRDRIVTAILIPFVPCSARIAVIFALAAAFTGPIWAIVVFAFVLLIMGINGKILSKFISKPIGLVLEIPALKLPSMKVSFEKTWIKIWDFFKEAIVFLVLGSVVLGWIEYFNIAHYINIVFQPVLEYVLGLPEELGSTLLFGFFRKELILVMANQALGVANVHQLPLSIDQMIVFIIFVTLYFPCFTTFIVIWKEFGAKVVLLSSILSILVAIVSSFLFKILLAI